MSISNPTRKELMRIVQGLERQNTELIVQAGKYLGYMTVLIERLETAADVMADQGLIHDTPSAKYEWAYRWPDAPRGDDYPQASRLVQ